MATTTDSDALIDSLYDDLRAALNALNDLYHPVYPATPARIAEYEGRVADLRTAITARKAALRAG